MAKHKSEDSDSRTLLLALPRDDAHARIADRIQKGQELLRRKILTEEHLSVAKSDFYTWDEYNRELLRRLFTSTDILDEYSSSGAFLISGEYNFSDEVQEFHDDVTRDIRKLNSIQERLELIPMAPTISSKHKEVSLSSPDNRNVFIVHGQDEALLQTVARFITQLDLQPIILHEQPSKGRTIVEKLEAYSDVRFAVVLLTPDDLGGTAADKLSHRARQNVVLELGFFLAKLGRDNVAALHKGDLELPSDYMGVIYIPVDSAGAWRFSLAKELKAAGLAIDLNKTLL